MTPSNEGTSHDFRAFGAAIAVVDIAAVASDNAGIECGMQDGILPLHVLCLREMGMVFGEMWELEALAADCAADDVYEFQLVAAPLMVTGAVGAPVNALAIK